jgi:transposase
VDPELLRYFGVLWTSITGADNFIRSERRLIEQLDYNLLFRWFVALSMDDPILDPTVFTKNRERPLRGDIARGFFERVLA